MVAVTLAGRRERHSCLRVVETHGRTGRTWTCGMRRRPWWQHAATDGVSLLVVVAAASAFKYAFVTCGTCDQVDAAVREFGLEIETLIHNTGK